MLRWLCGTPATAEAVSVHSLTAGPPLPPCAHSSLVSVCVGAGTELSSARSARVLTVEPSPLLDNSYSNKWHLRLNCMSLMIEVFLGLLALCLNIGSSGSWSILPTTNFFLKHVVLYSLSGSSWPPPQSSACCCFESAGIKGWPMHPVFLLLEWVLDSNLLPDVYFQIFSPILQASFHFILFFDVPEKPFFVLVVLFIYFYFWWQIRKQLSRAQSGCFPPPILFFSSFSFSFENVRGFSCDL